MASTDYLNDLRFCPDCGQPTSSSWRTWGNTVCESTSPKRKCKPLTAHNYCGRCGKADPGQSCEGCTNPSYRWWEYEPSDNERWFWTHFSVIETPLIAICCLIVSGGLAWFQVHVLHTRLASFQFLWLPLLAAGIATYGLLRSLVRLSWFALADNTANAREKETAEPVLASALPVARVVGTHAPRAALEPCPACGHRVSKRAVHCPQCGCELPSE